MKKVYSFNDYVSIINSALDSFVPECTYGEPVVCEAMKYSLGIGGKRIRPVLLLEFCRACGGEVEKAIPFAVALEMTRRDAEKYVVERIIEKEKVV